MKKNIKGYDLIIPVYNEKNIIKLIDYFYSKAKNLLKIYICYDFDEDITLKILKKSNYIDTQKIIFIKNSLKGPCEAIKAGIANSNAPAIIVYPADDFNNGLLLDKMYDLFNQGYDVVCPSRFIEGGLIKNCPLLKYLIVKIVSLSLFYFSKIKIKDPTNGFRMFSKKFINKHSLESKVGFAYSLELLIKARRNNHKIIEIPSVWIERKDRRSSFKIFKWSKAYLKWYVLALFS